MKPVHDNTPRVNPTILKTRMDNGEPIVFVDARPTDLWTRSPETLPGAIRIPPNSEEQHVRDIPHGRLLVTYDTGGSEGTSHRVAHKLRELNFLNAVTLDGGLDAWKAAGFPLDRKNVPHPPRQGDVPIPHT